MNNPIREPEVSPHRVLYAVATAMIFLAMLIAAIVVPEEGNTKAPRHEVDMMPVDIDTTPVLAGHDNATEVPLPIRVARASAVVRAEMVSLSDSTLVCNVRRVVHGRVSGDVLQVEEVPVDRFEVGREAILFVDQSHKPDQPDACRYLESFAGASPDGSLDQYDRRLMEVITSGSYLSPAEITPAGLGPYLGASDRVVRAKLTKRGADSCRWQVVKVIWMKRSSTEDHLPETIDVGLDAWWLRAESLARYEAAQRGDLPVRRSDVWDEFGYLVEKELPVGREAILLVRQRPGARDPAVWQLVAILPMTPGDSTSLDRIERELAVVCERT